VLTVSVQKVNDIAILKCRGRIVRGEEKSVLCAAIRASEQVVLDMSAVEAIDAAGIGMLVSLQAAGVYVTLLNPSRHVRTVLRLTELDSILPTVESVEEVEVASAPILSVNGNPASLPLAG